MPRFGSVRLRFGGGTVRAVPVFGSGGSSTKRVFLCFSTFLKQRTVRFRFLEHGSGGSGSAFGFGKKRFRRFRFPVPVRFLSHPEFFIVEEFIHSAGSCWLEDFMRRGCSSADHLPVDDLPLSTSHKVAGALAGDSLCLQPVVPTNT